ncbi:MAG: hypothetical protein L6R42_009926, partial [Xanthoria sp. 1 TBL-2021]
TWWYDASTNLAYGLSSLSDPQKNFYDLLQQLFENEWTTPPMLFAGALECAEYVKNTNSSNQPTLDLVTMQPRCISNTQSCEVNDPHCEFTGEYGGEDKLCKPAKEWLGNCGETYSTFSSRVPASYLGPMDTTDLGLEFCND